MNTTITSLLSAEPEHPGGRRLTLSVSVSSDTVRLFQVLTTQRRCFSVERLFSFRISG